MYSEILKYFLTPFSKVVKKSADFVFPLYLITLSLTVHKLPFCHKLLAVLHALPTWACCMPSLFWKNLSSSPCPAQPSPFPMRCCAPSHSDTILPAHCRALASCSRRHKFWNVEIRHTQPHIKQSIEKQKNGNSTYIGNKRFKASILNMQ